MATVLKNAALILLSEKCFDNYFIEYKFLDGPCFKALLSKALGIAIIAGSMMVNMPQVLKILNNKSGEGINLLGVLLNLTAITFHMSYSYMSGYPFSAWGDSTFLAIQTVAVAALVLHFNGNKLKAVIFCLTYAIVVYVLNSGMTPHSVLMTLQSINIPLMLGGKLSQAMTNYRNGSTGQLSAVTAFMLLGGSMARIFTSVQETGDSMIVLTFCVSTFANGIIVTQMLYYWNSTTKVDAKKKQ